MLYEEARVYLDEASKYGSVLGLDSIKILLDELGNPQEDLKFIHIAGTNGKGSLLACVSTILTEAGYKVGRYLSPTILGYAERFQINGKWMAEDELVFFVEKVKKASEQMTKAGLAAPTVFELETAIAFLYFKDQKCDYVVLETGMGGGTDATNIIPSPLVCAFASISMDHLGVLGNSLMEIASVKAGIIKKGACVVLGVQKAEVLEILKERARQLGNVLYPVDAAAICSLENSLEGQIFSYKEYQKLELSLLGGYQLENAATALEVIRALRDQGLAISEQDIRQGLKKVSWPARFQVARKSPLILVDGAHNEDAIQRLIENIDLYLKGRRIIGITGVFRDKEYLKMAEKMAKHLDQVFTIDLPNRERSLEKEILQTAYEKQGLKAQTKESIQEAILAASFIAKIYEQEGKASAVLLFGSLSYLGEALSYIEAM